MIFIEAEVKICQFQCLFLLENISIGSVGVEHEIYDKKRFGALRYQLNAAFHGDNTDLLIQNNTWRKSSTAKGEQSYKVRRKSDSQYRKSQITILHIFSLFCYFSSSSTSSQAKQQQQAEHTSPHLTTSYILFK